MMKGLLIIFVLIFYSAAFAQGIKPESKKKMVIAVIGDGVSKKPKDYGNCVPPENASDTVRKKMGESIWDGVALAFQCSKRDDVKELREVLSLEGFNDERDVKEARKIANELVNRPEIIAVIGHATSKTTKATAGIYEGSGIPVLTPATSHLIMLPNKELHENVLWKLFFPENRRVDNVFRILPSDQLAQAPAIAIFTGNMKINKGTNSKDQTEIKKILMVTDDSEDAKTYAGPLCKKTGEILKKFGFQIDQEPLNFNNGKSNPKDKKIIAKLGDSNFSPAINYHNPEAIIYCGYGKNAGIMMTELNEFYNSKDPKFFPKPKIIFSEAIIEKFIDVRGFDSYLAFPYTYINGISKEKRDFQNNKVNNPEFEIISNFLAGKPESFQVVGYDSMLIFAKAIKRCFDLKNDTSRGCIIDQLRSETFSGAMESYFFVDGENKLRTYNIYRLETIQNKAGELISKNHKTLNRKIRAGELASYLAGIQ